jgi:hypothetical protein
MKDALCRAFCDSLSVRDVPAGLAVRTAFADTQGDCIGFYVLNEGDGFRIEDSGTVLPGLEAQGLDFGSGSRGEAMQALLAEYAVELDDRQFSIDGLATEADVATAAIRFVAFLLRVSDFALMTEARIVSTFREDVKRMLSRELSGKAEILEEAPILPDLADFPADFVIKAPGRPPVGVYVATGDNRVLQAVIVRMRAEHETHEECKVVALVESGRTLTLPVRRQAANRLDALTEFRGDEGQSIRRVAQEALGSGATLH